MAIMYPQSFPIEIKNYPLRNAEYRIYDELSRQLSDDFHCFYSREWHGINPDGTEKDGEADFIIAHQEMGILVVEVKGGAVYKRDYDQKWFSKGRNGEHSIKDPINQAQTSKHNILDKLRRSKGWNNRWVNIKHGVILPDTETPKSDLGADGPLEIFAFGNDIPTLKNWIYKRLRISDDYRKNIEFGSEGLEILKNLIFGSFQLSEHLRSQLEHDGKEIERLTNEQKEILDSVDENTRLQIRGGAGTGKTILALEQAFRFACSGKRVLFTCYNSGLGNYLREKCADEENILAGGFHKICQDFLDKYGKLPNKNECNREEYYETILPMAFFELLDENPDLKFDAILIDEGQDFSDDLIDFFLGGLKSKEYSYFYIFSDDNQDVLSKQRTQAQTGFTYRLTQNLRNTKKIHNEISKWYVGGKTTCKGPLGTDVVKILAKNQDEERSIVDRIIKEKIASREISINDICVLSGMGINNSNLANLKSLGGYKITNLSNYTTNTLLCDTIKRFKGLERKCVIITEVEAALERETIYVATSRASLLLYIIGTQKTLDYFENEDGF